MAKSYENEQPVKAFGWAARDIPVVYRRNQSNGYSDIMVTDEHYVIHWPENLPMEAAPLLCAGNYNLKPIEIFWA
ncbi:hypothetical protein RND71_025303 [Anisodus tanguticus]|uniref:Uncharacterized protein n=1 Tax=Anisodus tanguticus TaxID=243964 RepID=A0AAE1V5N7_9SOLA|nr:hypothetical protein RND71_025303 [Anisodus tanguticus]